MASPNPTNPTTVKATKVLTVLLWRLGSTDGSVGTIHILWAIRLFFTMSIDPSASMVQLEGQAGQPTITISRLEMWTLHELLGAGTVEGAAEF
jgi:hypothetical protein